MNQPQFAYFCPQCSSPMVNIVLVTEQAVCRHCQWEGAKTDLLAMPMGESVDPAVMIQRLLTEIASTFARDFAIPFSQLLLRWGFLDQTNLHEEVSLYVKNAAGAVTASVLRTREQLEGLRAQRAQEHVRGKGSYDA